MKFTCYSRDNCRIFVMSNGYCTDNMQGRRGPPMSFRGQVTIPGTHTGPGR
jgi:hypothetical protein